MIKEGNFLLYTQILLFALLAYIGNFKQMITNPLLLLIFIAGATISAVASFNLGKESFSPTPYPLKTNLLSQKGLYRHIRHPMYTGLITVGAALLVSRFRLETFVVFAAFVIILNAKADLEEELLAKKHKEYQAYIQKTKKFIPFLF